MAKPKTRIEAVGRSKGLVEFYPWWWGSLASNAGKISIKKACTWRTIGEVGGTYQITCDVGELEIEVDGVVSPEKLPEDNSRVVKASNKVRVHATEDNSKGSFTYS